MKEKKLNIVDLWILKAIVNGEVVAITYALEFSHLPHCSFSNADWSDSTTEETDCLTFDQTDPEMKEAINNSKKYLADQIKQYSHLLIDELNYEQQTEILYNKSRASSLSAIW